MTNIDEINKQLNILKILLQKLKMNRLYLPNYNDCELFPIFFNNISTAIKKLLKSKDSIKLDLNKSEIRYKLELEIIELKDISKWLVIKYKPFNDCYCKLRIYPYSKINIDFYLLDIQRYILKDCIMILIEYLFYKGLTLEELRKIYMGD